MQHSVAAVLDPPLACLSLWAMWLCCQLSTHSSLFIAFHRQPAGSRVACRCRSSVALSAPSGVCAYQSAMSASSASDEAELTELNEAFIQADNTADKGFFRERFTDDFLSTLPDQVVYTKPQFVAMMEGPRPYTHLACSEVRVRVMGDFAIIHSKISFKTRDGLMHTGRYTDDWLRTSNGWKCVSATVIADNVMV